jgi:hypothetical protein
MYFKINIEFNIFNSIYYPLKSSKPDKAIKLIRSQKYPLNSIRQILNILKSTANIYKISLTRDFDLFCQITQLAFLQPQESPQLVQLLQQLVQLLQQLVQLLQQLAQLLQQLVQLLQQLVQLLQQLVQLQ